ncbi:MAG: hypothetical protein R3F49_15835 [Planctomycetota bacterium]
MHDDDLVPFAQRGEVSATGSWDFKRALAGPRLAVPMATTNPFGQPIFKDGAFSASDSTLARPEMVGANPEVARETMAGLSIVHGVAQAMEQGEPFHIDLNGQKIGRYDQDLRFGSEDLKQALRSAGCPDRPPRPAKPTLPGPDTTTAGAWIAEPTVHFLRMSMARCCTQGKTRRSLGGHPDDRLPSRRLALSHWLLRVSF